MQLSRCHCNFPAVSSSFLLTRSWVCYDPQNNQVLPYNDQMLPNIKARCFRFPTNPLQVTYRLISQPVPGRLHILLTFPLFSFHVGVADCLFLTHTSCICVLGTLHKLFLLLHTFLSQIRRSFNSLPVFRLCQGTFSEKPCSHHHPP